MPPLASRLRGFSCALLAATLLIAGCGGAESRKVKHLEKGETFLAAGNFEKARVEFRNALQIAPTDSEARYENGLVDEKLGNIREAAQYYQGALDSNADNLKARASLGRLYLLSGSPEQALSIAKPGLEKHPDDVSLLTVRAAGRIQIKDVSGALADAERAVRLGPANEDAVAVLAGIYKSQDQTDKAQALLEEAVKRAPNTVELRLALAQLYAGSGQQAQVEALLLELVRLQPGEKAHRIRLAQYYAGLNHADEAEQTLRQGVKDLPDTRDLKIALVQFLEARRSREAAEKEFNTLIAADPTDYELKFALGQFYEQGKEVQKAEAVYGGVIKDARTDGPGLVARNRLAALLVEQNDIAGAEKLIAQVLDKAPRDDDALILRGNLALAQKDPKSAIVDLRSVLRDQPNAVGVMRTLARAHLANGEPALAEETMRRALEANPRNPNVRVDLAELLTKIGKPEQAKPIIDELIKQQPNNYAALDIQFKVDTANKDLAGAKAAAAEMVALQPRQSLGYYYRGAIAESEKRPDDATQLYTKALELAPEAQEPLQGLARVLVGLNRTPEALRRLDAVIAAYPSSPIAANLKGEFLLELQRPAEAGLAFKTAVDRNPKLPVSYRNLALAEYVSKDANGAIATLQAGIGKVDSPEVLEAELASLYERLARYDDAIKVYEGALRRDPRSEVAANNLAMLLVTYRKDPASLDRAKSLSARFADSLNSAFLDTYGWVLYKRGEGAAAVIALQNSAARTPDSPVLLYHLGMAQVMAGQAEAARDNLARSLQSGKQFSGMDEAKATLEKLAKLASNSAPQPKS
jgi:tetratricopeptide (TPR) repeat protein